MSEILSEITFIDTPPGSAVGLQLAALGIRYTYPTTDQQAAIEAKLAPMKTALSATP